MNNDKSSIFDKINKMLDENDVVLFMKGDEDFPQCGFSANVVGILNYFNIESGLSIDHWISKGWIFSEDPIGWFQWYCRYSIGRRLPDVDKVQIMRWKAFGPRHIGAIKKNCAENNYLCRPRQRQGLLQWAYNPFF